MPGVVLTWLRGTSATRNPSASMTFEKHARNTRRIQRPEKFEDHVLPGHAGFLSWCAACVQGQGRAERHQAQGRKELEDGSKIRVLSWDYCFLGTRNRINEAEVEQRGDSPVLVKSIFPAKGVDFPSCEKLVKMIIQDLDSLGCHRVVFRAVCQQHAPSVFGWSRRQDNIRRK